MLSHSIASTFLTALAVFSNLASAAPAPLTARDQVDLSRYSLPANGGGSELPAPSGVALKYVALGRGVQNYTCASSSATPVAIGAIASLYDASVLLELSQDVFNVITQYVAYLPDPLDFPVQNIGKIQPIGHHFFNAAGSPTFQFNDGDILIAKKTGDIPAPANASKGPAGTGAVDWLQLQDKGGSVGLSEVYRVETSGGKAPATCAGQPATFSIQYAAQYWLYD